MGLVEKISLDKISWEMHWLKLTEDEYERLWQTTSDLGDLTIAEQLEIEFRQDRQIQSEKAYKTRSGRVSIQKKSKDFMY